MGHFKQDMAYFGVIVRVRENYLVAWCNEVNLVGIYKDDVREHLWSMGTCEWVRMHVEELAPQFIPEEGVYHFAARAVPADSTEIPAGLRFVADRETIKVVGTRLTFLEQRYVDAEKHHLGGLWAPVRHALIWAVAAPAAVYRDIRPVQDYFDATIILNPHPARDEPFPWRVVHFCKNSVEHTLGGYMSAIGHGKWQRPGPATASHCNNTAAASTVVSGNSSHIVMLPAVTTMPQNKQRSVRQRSNRKNRKNNRPPFQPVGEEW